MQKEHLWACDDLEEGSYCMNSQHEMAAGKRNCTDGSPSRRERDEFWFGVLQFGCQRAMNGHPLEARSYRDKEKPALSPTCKIFWWEGRISFGIFWEIYLSVYNVSWGWSLGEMPPVTWEQKSCFVLKEGRSLLGLNVQGTPEYVHGGEKGEEWTQRKVERKAVSESWVVLSHWAWLKHGWDLQGDGWSSHH